MAYVRFTTTRDIQIDLSIDGGITFAYLATVAAGAGLDQPTVTTGAGSVWITYQNTGDFIAARGATVTNLGAANVGAFGAEQSVPNSDIGNFGDIAIGPVGQVLVTYQKPIDGEGPSAIFVSLDDDGVGPHTFANPVQATATNVGGFDIIPAQPTRTITAGAGVGYDRSGGSHNGRVYLDYTDETLDAFGNETSDTDIYVRYSDDNGSTWSDRVRVNDVTTNSQFFPSIAVDQTTGYVAVSWHDARNAGSGNNTAELFASVSVDGGTNFLANRRVSTGTSNEANANPPDPCCADLDYGDYTGLDYFGGSFYPVWADNSNSTNNNPDGTGHQFDIYTARVTFGAGSQDLTVTGTADADRYDVRVDTSGTYLQFFENNAAMTGVPTFTATNATVGTVSVNGLGGDDTLSTAAAVDRPFNVQGGDGSDSLITGTASDTLNGGPGNDFLRGGGSGDQLLGQSGNDTLDGEAGGDVLTGGSDSDTYRFADAWGQDTITESATDGTNDIASFVNVGAATSLTFAVAAGSVTQGTNALTFPAGNVETLIGGSGNDIFNIASNATMVLQGGGGSDAFSFTGNGVVLTGSLDGQSGNDTLSYSGYTSTSVALTITETLLGVGFSGNGAGFSGAGSGFFGIDTLVGGSASDTLTGPNVANTWNLAPSKLTSGGVVLDFSGFETFAGGAGADTLVGRDDADTEWNVTGNNSGNITSGPSFSGMEKLLGTAIGSGRKDTFKFGGGVTFSGDIDGTASPAGSPDTLDLSSYTTAVDLVLSGVTANGFGGNGTGFAAGKSFSAIKSIIGGTGVAITDSLRGVDAANSWSVSPTPSVSSGGQPLNFSNFESLIGGAQVDTFTIMGAPAVNLRGGSGNDVFLFANTTARVAGSVNGEGGDDRLDYSNYPMGTGVVVDLNTATAPGAPGVDGTIASLENVTGGAGNDSLTGTAGPNTLIGGDGNDTLIGGASGDQLTGGSGNDMTSYATAASGVNANLATGVVSGGDSDTLTITVGLEIEWVIGSNFTDTLTGGTPAETLEGGGGDDNLVGGGGNDTYRFDLDNALGTDTINDSSGTADLLDFSPSDFGVTVNLSSVGTPQKVVDQSGVLILFLSPANTIENVTGGAGADSITGSASANTLSGAAGNDILVDGEGNDCLVGGSGNDTYIFTNPTVAQTDKVFEDTVSGSGSDTFDFVAVMVKKFTVDLNTPANVTPTA